LDKGRNQGNASHSSTNLFRYKFQKKRFSSGRNDSSSNGLGPVAKETTIDPILLDPSVTEIKNPFSNFWICKEKFRLSKHTVF